MKLTPIEIATLYAAQTEIKKLLDKTDKNGKKVNPLPVGEYHVSGNIVEIELPEMNVNRDGGKDGDGIIHKTATQNLYGWAVITALADRLKRFNQWDKVRQPLLEAIREVLKSNSKTLGSELSEIDETFAAQVEKIKQELRPPTRPEDTPRTINRLRKKQPCRIKIET